MDEYEDAYDGCEIGGSDEVGLLDGFWDAGFDSLGDLEIDLSGDIMTDCGADDELFDEDIATYSGSENLVEPEELVFDEDRELYHDSMPNEGDDDALHGMDETGDSSQDAVSDTNDARLDGELEGELDAVRDWLGEINPQYDPYDAESPYGTNCGSCAAATWDRFNGSETAIASDATLSAREMEEHTGCKQVEASPEEIEEYVKSLGAGGHVVVGVDRVEGPGHWFNAYTPDGEHVYYVDGQTNEIHGWPPSNLGEVAKWDVSYIRNPKAEGK